MRHIGHDSYNCATGDWRRPLTPFNSLILNFALLILIVGVLVFVILLFGG